MMIKCVSNFRYHKNQQLDNRRPGVGQKTFPHLKLTFGTDELDELIDKLICDKETTGKIHLGSTIKYVSYFDQITHVLEGRNIL